MKNLLTFIFALLFGSSAIAQIPELTKQAAAEYQAKNYTEAQTLIDESIVGEGADDAYTWHVRGHIYKEVYKQVDNFDRSTGSRPESVKSFLKSLEMDDAQEYVEWNRTSLKYLASTYWNDAVNIIENADTDGLQEAEGSFEQYVEAQQAFNMDFDQQKVTLDFYKAYATANRKIIEQKRKAGMAPDSYIIELERIRKSYQSALGADTDDYGSNYNFAINLYNEAAYRIERIPVDADLTVLILEQEGCIDIFKEALPYALKAYDKKPGRIEILKALRAITLSLNDYDEFDRYDALIKEKQGEIQTPKAPRKKGDPLSREIFGKQKIDR